MLKTNEPNAARLITGLRDTGYDFQTAAADIIDNSISAGACNIYVTIELRSDGRKLVHFGDDGHGMSEGELWNAMRYGADKRPIAKSLGKFGLGLKTASSSICKRYSVLSRTASDTISKMTWDLDHVENVNAWELLSDQPSADQLETFEELCGESGTLVIWENCDRLLKKDYKGGVGEQQAVKRLADTLRKHLSLVFHRFLDADDTRERNLAITVNNMRVLPWNPFYPAKSDQVLSPSKQSIELELSDGTLKFAKMMAWILPHRRDMTKEEEANFARISNKSQGFYVYREGRLIHDGGWMDVFGASEPHTSLLRIEFDFGYELDEAFRIDVKKSRILFHPDLEEGLRKILQPVYREAQQRYRRQSLEQATKTDKVDHSSANRNIADTANVIKPQVSNADVSTQTAVVSNNRGTRIQLKGVVQNFVEDGKVFVEAVSDIRSGSLWECALRSVATEGHVPGVRLNQYHDFYNKIYRRAAANRYAVEGIDMLLYAFALAELNNTDEGLAKVFEDIRDEISTNLKKFLRNMPDPEPGELNEQDPDL